MTGALWRSALVAALFGLHPLHVESVAWVSERKDVLSTLFFMLTLLAYHHYVQRPTMPRYAAVFVLLALGLMSKPMLVTVPFVLLLLDYWPLGAASSGLAECEASRRHETWCRGGTPEVESEDDGRNGNVKARRTAGDRASDTADGRRSDECRAARATWPTRRCRRREAEQPPADERETAAFAS